MQGAGDKVLICVLQGMPGLGGGAAGAGALDFLRNNPQVSKILLSFLFVLKSSNEVLTFDSKSSY